MFHRPHWSYSAISQYLACPLKFYFQRVLGLPQQKVNSSLVLGSALHSSLARYHRNLKKREATAKEDLDQAFITAWHEREHETNVTYRDGETRNDAIDKGIALIETYLKEPPPENIVTVEEEIIGPVHNSDGEYLETPLVAVADLVTQQGGTLQITEIKTSGRAYSEMEVETSLQPLCYTNAILESFKQAPTVEYAILIKTKKPRVQRLQTARTEAELGRLGDLIQTIERAIGAKAFYPIETCLNCSSCPYRQPCKEWGRRTPIRPN